MAVWTEQDSKVLNACSKVSAALMGLSHSEREFVFRFTTDWLSTLDGIERRAQVSPPPINGNGKNRGGRPRKFAPPMVQ